MTEKREPIAGGTLVSEMEEGRKLAQAQQDGISAKVAIAIGLPTNQEDLTIAPHE